MAQLGLCGVLACGTLGPTVGVALGGCGGAEAGTGGAGPVGAGLETAVRGF